MINLRKSIFIELRPQLSLTQTEIIQEIYVLPEVSYHTGAWLLLEPVAPFTLPVNQQLNFLNTWTDPSFQETYNGVVKHTIPSNFLQMKIMQKIC